MGTPPPEQPRRTGPRLLLFLAGLTGIGPITVSLYLSALPDITAELGVSAAQVQLTITATLIGLALGQLVLGSVSDALGRRRPLIAAFGAYVVISLLIAAVPTVELLLVLRFLQGLTAAAGMVISLAVVRDTSDGVSAGKVISRLMLVVGVAPVAAPVLGSQLLLVGSWRLMFVSLALAALVLLVLVAVRMRETLPVAHRRPTGALWAVRSYLALLRDPAFAGLVLVAGFSMGASFTYVASASFIYQETYGLTPQEFGLVYSLGAIVITLGTQVTGFLLGRVPAGRVVGGAIVVGLVMTTGMVAIGATVGATAGGLLPLLTVLLPTLCCIGAIMPAIPAMALAHRAHAAGSASALIGATQFGMAAVVAPISGLLGSSALAMSAVMLGAFAMAGLVALVTVRSSTSR